MTNFNGGMCKDKYTLARAGFVDFDRRNEG